MGLLSGITDIFTGGDEEQTTSSQVSIPEWLLPHVKPSYIRSAKLGDRISRQKYTPYGGQDVARMSPGQKSALGGLYRAPNASVYNPNNQAYARDPNFRKAERYTGNVLSGKFMEGNPYLQGMVDKTKRGVTDTFTKTAMPQMQANLARQGAFGGSGWNQQNQDMYGELAQQLGDVESGMRFQNYGIERGYMDKAVGDAMAQDMSDLDVMRARINAQQAKEGSMQNALQAGELSRGINQKQLDIDRADWEEKRDWLFRALQGLQGGLGNTDALLGRTATSEGSGGGNLLGSLGQLAGGAGMFMMGRK